MRPHLVRFSLIACGLAAAAFAAPPNFTGDWKLNAGKSDFGQWPAPSSMTQRVTHSEPKLTVAVKQTSEMGDFDTNASYTTDGKECTNSGFQGAEMKSIVKWDGEALTLETKGKFGDNDFTMKDRWTLSANGKTLTCAADQAPSIYRKLRLSSRRVQ
jgi:hypothetical protein